LHENAANWALGGTSGGAAAEGAIEDATRNTTAKLGGKTLLIMKTATS
jgi:hypothetical protein